MMFSALRKRIHLSPATVIAGLALMFAMTGGAYAAKKYLITSTKQISPSVLASLKGKAGTAGPAGPAGPAGTGSQGPQGPAGTKGADGSPGPQGSQGPAGAQGLQGKQGVIHPEETLPSGASETGTWTLAIGPTLPGLGELGIGTAAISFTIPLAEAQDPGRVVYLPEAYGTPGFEGAAKPECPGNAREAKAEPGFLCIYEQGSFKSIEVGPTVTRQEHEENPTGPPIESTTVTVESADGVVIGTQSEEANGLAWGSWAVTAE
jgi:hypothetical protein